MGWDNVIDLAGVVVPVTVAIVVARMVSGREDRRQREAERRAVQRETIIALQDGWLELNEKLTNVRLLIQRHHAIAKQMKSEMQARFEALSKGGSPEHQPLSFEQEAEKAQAQADEVNHSSDQMVAAVQDLRRFARRIALLESRVSAAGVKTRSKEMRALVEAMIVDVGTRGGERYDAIRTEQLEPAYDQFIMAGYEVLADIERREAEATRR